MTACAACVLAEDMQSVQADFDRCAGVMERIERLLREYEETVQRLQRFHGHMPSVDTSTAEDGVNALVRRIDYFRNRVERAAGLADKTRDDLKNVSGPTCPSCVISAVNLYCRHTEILRDDIDEYREKAFVLESRLSSRQKGPGDTGGASADYERETSSLDSSMARAENVLASCDKRAAAAFFRQALVNRKRADSLYAAGMTDRAHNTISLSRVLLHKAFSACEGL